MEALLKVRLLSTFNSAEPLVTRGSPFRQCHSRRRNPAVSVFRSSLPGEDALQMFLKERQLNGDFVSKAYDILWRRNDLKFIDSEDTLLDDNPPQLQLEEFMEAENDGGFLKLTKTQEWVSGDPTAPFNRKAVRKKLQNDSERRKRLNLLQYDAIKKEMIFLTAGIGTLCSGYCLVVFSI